MTTSQPVDSTLDQATAPSNNEIAAEVLAASGTKAGG
jgi:hypothetical protein